MITKELTKQDKIFDLYSKLSKNGERSEFIRQFAKQVDRKYNTISNHWLLGREIPDTIDERHIDWAIAYLQNRIRLQ